MLCLRSFRKGTNLHRYSIDCVNKILVAFSLLVFMLPNAHGSETKDDSPKVRRTLTPHNISIQYAGNIGVLSPGFGYDYLKHFKFEFFGTFIPEHFAGTNMVIIAVKNLYTPIQIPLSPGYEIKPLSLGLLISHTFGRDFFTTTRNLPYNYRYYSYSSSTRIAFLYQLSINHHLQSDRAKVIKGMSFYVEMGLHDLELPLLFQNKELSVYDAFTAGLGVRLKIR